MLLQSKITIGTAIATFGYVKSFIFPFRYIINELRNIKSARCAKEKLLDFMKEDEETPDRITEFNSSIEFSNVSVSFDNFELSGGEKQLLALVKIMLINRDIIILDEPFSALDIRNTLLMQDKVYSLKNKTMIVITHNLSENNLSYFDEVIIMNNGYIEKSGTAAEVMKSIEYGNLVKSA